MPLAHKYYLDVIEYPISKVCWLRFACFGLLFSLLQNGRDAKRRLSSAKKRALRIERPEMALLPVTVMRSVSCVFARE